MTHPRRRAPESSTTLGRTLAVVLSLAAAGPAAAQGGPPGGVPALPPDVRTLVAHEIQAVEFAGGGTPLTPAERQQVADAVGLALRIDAATWRADDRAWTRQMAKAARDPAVAASQREFSRAVYELARFTDPKAFPHPQFAPVNAMERPIIQAHDPAVVVDDAKQDGVAHIAANLPYAPAFFRQQGPAKTAAYFGQFRAAVAANTPASQVEMAEAVAVIAAHTRKLLAQSGGGEAGALAGSLSQMRQSELLNQQLLRAQRRGMAGCNVAAGQPAGRTFCNP